MSHRVNSIIACLAMITLAIASHTPATAQDQGTASLASLMNLEFKGGSAAEFVETIRRIHDHRAGGTARVHERRRELRESKQLTEVRRTEAR